MKNLMFAFLLSILLVPVSNCCHAQQLDGKFWVQNTKTPTKNDFVFQAKASYVKNTQTPYAPLVFKLQSNNEATLFDWGICKSTTPKAKAAGTWSINNEQLTITSPQCKITFHIIYSSEQALKLKIINRTIIHSSN